MYIIILLGFGLDWNKTALAGKKNIITEILSIFFFIFLFLKVYKSLLYTNFYFIFETILLESMVDDYFWIIFRVIFSVIFVNWSLNYFIKILEMNFQKLFVRFKKQNSNNDFSSLFLLYILN